MSERLPSLRTVPARAKKKAGPEIVRAYHDNQRRLLSELAKDHQDRFTRNNIRAYRHIIYWLEEEYDIK